MSAQPLIGAPTAHIPQISQKLVVDSQTKQHFIPVALIQPAQASIIMDLTAEGPSNDRFIGPINHDKWSTIEEKLRAVKKNDLFDPF